MLQTKCILSPLGHPTKVTSGAQHVPQPAEWIEMLKLPCMALHPARIWGSRGTCQWFGCSIHSHRSWSIQHWQSTPRKPAPETLGCYCQCHHNPLTHLVPTPCPVTMVGAAIVPQTIPKAIWNGGGHGFQINDLCACYHSCSSKY